MAFARPDSKLRVLFLLFLVAVNAGCSMGAKRSDSMPGSTSRPQAPSPAVTTESGQGAPSIGMTSNSGDTTRIVVPAGQPVVRKIVKNGELSLVVKVFEPFSDALQKQVTDAGGYVSQTQVNRGVKSISSAHVTLRVPPEKLDALVAWLRTQGIVTSEKITAEDVSEQYYDLKARLDNARRFEERLLAMLKTQTGNLQEVVLVEEKLNQVRQQIEQFEGRLRYLDNLIGMSVLTLNVSVEEHYVSPAAPTFGDRAARVWRDSVESLQEFTQGIGLLLVALVPWSIPIALVLAGFWFVGKLVWRFLKKRFKGANPQ